ncbi:MAG: hypothetical protein FWF94_05870 [Oscillospiraceae bacterium]|nr:hypothetical protein [Oscillospiraceae bacterium]
MKKLLSPLLTAAMLCALTLPVLATTPADNAQTRNADIFDFIDILEDCVGMIELTPVEVYDHNKNGVVDIFDGIIVLEGIIGLGDCVTMPRVNNQGDDDDQGGTEPPVTTIGVPETTVLVDETEPVVPATNAPETTTPPENTTGVTETTEEPPTTTQSATDEDVDFGVVNYAYIGLSFEVEAKVLYGQKFKIYTAQTLEEYKFITRIVNKGNVEYDFLNFDVDESFFIDKAIILVYRVWSNAGGFTIIDSLKREQNQLIINSTSISPCSSDDAITFYRIALSIDKNNINDIDDIIFDDKLSDFCKCGSCDYNNIIENFTKWRNNWLESKK